MSAVIARHLQLPQLPDLVSGSMFRSRSQRALFLFAIWSLFGLSQFIGLLPFLSQATLPGAWLPRFADKMADGWAWALLTPTILMVDRKLHRFDAKPLLHAGTFLLFSAPFSCIHAYLAGVMLYPFADVWWTPVRTPSYFAFWFLGGWQTCCIIIGTLEAFRYYRHYLTERMAVERAEKRLLESHLNTLRMQLEPHFLFNALNAISSEIVFDHDSARGMIADLGALLRLSLDYRDNQEIPLSEELVLLDHYLRIQRIRFGDRIKISISVSPDVQDTLVPTMLLQPIVENAFRHGVGKGVRGGTVIISAAAAGDSIELRVEDDGVGLGYNWRMETCSGLGLRVTRERLEGLYPNIKQPLEIRRRNPEGTEVIMRVPARPANVI